MQESLVSPGTVDQQIGITQYTSLAVLPHCWVLMSRSIGTAGEVEATMRKLVRIRM